MNLMEGLRRVGVVIGVVVVATVGTVAATADPPTENAVNWAAGNKISDAHWDSQKSEVKAGSYQHKMDEGLWPGKSRAEIAEIYCSTVESTWKLFPVCVERKESLASPIKRWGLHAAMVAASAAAGGAVWALLWSAFMWVIGGFASPRRPAP